MEKTYKRRIIKDFFTKKNCIIVLKDLALYNKVIKLYYNNPLAGHYRVEKTFKLLKRS
jgi:hypothetical protein